MFWRRKSQVEELIARGAMSALQVFTKEQEKLIASVQERDKLKVELADLKVQKTIETREIEHLVKCKEQKAEIEAEKREVALEKRFQEKEMTLQTDFHNKTLEMLNKKADEFKQLYTEIMKRLPEINVEVKR